MNIYAEEGDKVVFAHLNLGYEGDRIRAQKYLKEGQIYTVDWTDVGDWYSYVYLQEIPNQPFNTVMFEDV